MKPFTFGSLFSGIGGIDLGLERAGMTCTYQVEIDDYATRVLAKHWPHVPRFRDVRSVGAHNLPAVDLICGGFPCQGISDAGRKKGLADPRSGLWREFARIIGELRPRYVLVENVAALLHRGLGRVLGDLATLGYDARWQCIPAASVGAPHRRDRIFIVAYPSIARNRRLSVQPGRQNQAGAYLNRGGEAAPDATSARLQDWHTSALQGRTESEWPPLKPERCDWWAVEPSMGRVADGVPARVDRLRGIGLAVVPQVAELIGRWIMEYEASL